MTNLVTEFWEIDGQSLHTFGATASTLGGDLTGGVEMRGSNLEVPYRPGEIWRAKTPGARTISLGFLVTGLNPDGTSQPTADLERARRNENLRALRRLLWRDAGDRFTLTKHWLAADFSVGSPTAALTSASALAEFVGGMDPESEDGDVVSFSVDLLLADPFFYGAPVTRTATIATPTTVTNDGDATVTGSQASVVFTGPLTNPVLTIDGKTLRLGAVIGSGDAVTVDLDAYTATRTSDGANMIGALTHTGSRFLLPVPIGTKAMTLTGSGSGSAALTFRPPHL